jgi:hypothetical protein
VNEKNSGGPAGTGKPQTNAKPRRPGTFLVAILLLVAGGLIFGDFLFGEKLLLYKDVGADSVNDTYPTFVHLSDYVRRYGFPSWSFSVGMGQSIFHLAGNLIWEPVVWLPRRFIAGALVYQHLFKTLIAGWLFFSFLRLRGLNLCSSFTGALALAFSAQMCMGSCWIISADDTVCFAFVLFAAEAAITSERWVYLPIAVALSGLVTVFHLYLSAVLLFLYVPARLFEIQGWRPKVLASLCARLAILALLGVGLGAVVFLGSFYSVLNTPRASGAIPNFAFGLAPRSPFGLGSPLYYITALLRPLSTDLIGTGDAYRGWENYYEGPPSYCGLLPLLILPQLFIGATRRQRILYPLFLALITVPIVFPWFRYLFWLFRGGYFRTFSLLSIFAVLVMSMTALSRYLERTKINLWALGATLALLLLILHSPFHEMQTLINHELGWAATVFLILYAALLTIGQMTGRRRIAGWIIVGLTAIELIAFDRLTVNRPTITKAELKRRIGYNDEMVDAVRAIKASDRDFFRITKTWGSVDAGGVGYNDAMVFGYYGTTSYSTYNNLNYIRFLIAVDAIDRTNPSRGAQFSPGLLCCPFLLAFACEKYVVTPDPGWFQIAREYDFVRRYNDIHVFRNNYSLSFGVVYTSCLTEEMFLQLQTDTRRSALLQIVVLPNSAAADQSGLAPLSPEEVERRVRGTPERDVLVERQTAALKVQLFEPSHISGSVQLDQNGVLLFQMPFDAGWHSSVDGDEVPTMKVDVGLLGIALKAGQHAVELVYRPPFLLAGGIVTLISCCIFAFSLWKWPRIRGLSSE